MKKVVVMLGLMSGSSQEMRWLSFPSVKVSVCGPNYDWCQSHGDQACQDHQVVDCSQGGVERGVPILTSC